MLANHHEVIMEDHNTIHIKNMVCPRCIMAVEDLFKVLNIEIKSIRLGEVVVSRKLEDETKRQLAKQLKDLGFALLEPGKSLIISQIKSMLIQQIHHTNEPLKVNYSTFLSENLHHDYSYLSRLFSSVEGVTIEKFITAQKIERVKELLFYNEMNLSEIAFQMNYSSVAHLSAQFKKETGMTPSAFKKQKSPGHHYLNDT